MHGKKYGAEDWVIKSVKALSPSSVALMLELPDHELSSKLTISIDSNKITMNLTTRNISNKTLSWKLVFPQIGGLELSRENNEDYYLFPLWGGIISSTNTNLRSFYGGDTAWWQMIDIFSPSGGAGFTLRSLDKTGIYKGVAMRKGETPAPGATYYKNVSNNDMDPHMGWSASLAPGPGESMGFEYLEYTRSPGKSLATPSAAIQMHLGDWHKAMDIYSKWAHTVWKWRPLPSKLSDVWNIQAVGWGKSPLYSNSRWRTDFINSYADASELMSWWQWSEKGPWQTPMNNLEEGLGRRAYTRYMPYFVINPANGKLEYTLNRGDYAYSKDWGGLPALKKELQSIRTGGQLPILYMDPVIADDNTQLGRKYGPTYGIMDPHWKDPYNTPADPPGYMAKFESWQMDIDSRWYQSFAVNQVTRIALETGVDGIRLDEFGFGGYVNYNTRHKDVYGEKGQNGWLQATAYICNRIHQKIDHVRSGFTLITEYPGYDYLAANLEGSLDYESSAHIIKSLRPIPLNIFRFYFPEDKLFDLDNRNRKDSEAWRFWNATGSFENLYHPLYHAILKENSDAFSSREITPLIPTLLERVYANRFSGGGKVITLLYNATGSHVDQPVLGAPPVSGFHYFDLIHNKDLATKDGTVTVILAPNQVAAVALLPDIMSVKKENSIWHIHLNRKLLNTSVELSNEDGIDIYRVSLKSQDAIIDMKLLTHHATPTAIKLFSGKYLLDAQSLLPLPQHYQSAKTR